MLRLIGNRWRSSDADELFAEAIDANLGRTAQEGGHHAVAIEARDRVETTRRLRLGDRHPATLTARANLERWKAGPDKV